MLELEKTPHDADPDLIEENVKMTNTYNEGDLLAITIAPDDKHQWALSKDRYPDFYKYHLDLITNAFQNTSIKYYFTLELSEPIGLKITNWPRLHLHGMVKLNKKLDVFKFLCNSFPKLSSNNLLTIKHIPSQEDYDLWSKYMVVQAPYMPSNVISSHSSMSQFKMDAHVAALPLYKDNNEVIDEQMIKYQNKKTYRNIKK